MINTHDVRIVVGNRVDYVFTLAEPLVVKAPERDPITATTVRVELERDTEDDNWFAVSAIFIRGASDDVPAVLFFKPRGEDIPPEITELADRALAHISRRVEGA